MATMFPCPNCGGQLRYWVPSGTLKCHSCGSEIGVDDYTPDDSITADQITTNIYTCSTCGGEIQLIDNDGMEFCPYCGNQTIMHERFSKQGAPRFILPFMLTKEDAGNRYNSATKKLPFAPDGLANKQNIDRMVGLYTPYYLYDYSFNNRISYNGTKSRRSGNYDIVDYANVNVDVNYNDIYVPYDASQTLDDNIAGELEPFPMDKLKSFNPNYLAGYFVENSTIDNQLYVDESHEKAVDIVYNRVVESAGGYKPQTQLGAGDALKNNVLNSLGWRGVSGAYLPLYFMTSKYNDRVAYSIVNGTNGKTYIDMPIEKGKMFVAGVIASIISFIVILLATYSLGNSYQIKGLCAFAAMISSIISLTGAVLANKTYRMDNHLDDLGYFGTKENTQGIRGIKSKKSVSKNDFSLSVFFYMLVSFVIIAIVFNSTFIIQFPWGAILYLASAFCVIVALINVHKGRKKVMLLGILSWLLAIITRVLDMPNDIFYYGALAVVFVVIIVSINAIVDEYNRFATHPSPQFLKRGGGLENAKDSI